MGDHLKPVGDKGAPDLDGIDEVPIPVKAKLEEVGQDEVREGMTITGKLLRVLDMAEIIFGWPLSLDVADNVLLAVPDPEVRIAGLGLLRQRRNVGVALAGRFGECSDELLQGRIVARLGGIAPLRYIKDLLKVSSQHQGPL